jgi:hypothetical protein
MALVFSSNVQLANYNTTTAHLQFHFDAIFHLYTFREIEYDKDNIDGLFSQE